MAQMLNISIKTIEESPNYRTDPKYQNYKPLKMTHAIITIDGMESGKPSLDFQFEDEQGNKYMTLLQGDIFRGIALMAKNQFKDGGAPLV